MAIVHNNFFLIKLRGAKRFAPNNHLIEFLDCMRAIATIFIRIWKLFKPIFNYDFHGELDLRHTDEKIMHSYNMAMYWETLSRCIPRHALRDAKTKKMPLIFCQTADECKTMDRDAATRFLDLHNIHHNGHMHGVFQVHVGMRVRLMQKINATFGFVQNQKATILDIVMHLYDAHYRLA